MRMEDAKALRDVLWEDDSLRQRFVLDNPAHLPTSDLELVFSWANRVQGSFFVVRHLKRYSVFMDGSSVFGVLGLYSSIEELLGPKLPQYTEAVLLPFADCIIVDGLLVRDTISFGPGIRKNLQERYRRAHDMGAIVTSLQ
jgi:hypothetical protein